MSTTVRRVAPGVAVEAVVEGAPSGLAGTIGVQVIGQSSVIIPRTAAGIIEQPAGSGVYEAVLPPLGPSRYAILWDTGTVTPSSTAVEDLLVTAVAGDGFTVAASQPMLVTASGLPTGLAGTVEVQVVDNVGGVTIPPTAAGITEYPAGSGVYWAALIAPAVNGDFTAVFDDGSGHYRVQEFAVTSDTGGGGGGGGAGGGSALSTMPPYLAFCNVEVANAARVASYLANGLVQNSHFTADPGPLPSILWRTAGVAAFIDPVTDLAPWYHPDVVESGDYLGFFVNDVQGFDTTETRTSTAGGSFRSGGVLDAAVLQERELKVHGWLIGRSCDGLEYGRRWLADMLGAQPPCSDCDLQIRMSPPPEDGSADERGAWRAYRVALRDLVVTDPYGCCDLREVNLTLVAGDPVLYKEPLLCLDHAIVSPSSIPGSGPCIPFDEWFCGAPVDAPVCCTVLPPAYGTVGAIIRLDSNEAFGGARITINPVCAPASGEPAAAEVTVGPLEDGASLIIDAARHLATYLSPDGSVWDGVPYLIPPPDSSVPWLEVASRDVAGCICVEPLAPCAGGGQTTVTVTTQGWSR